MQKKSHHKGIDKRKARQNADFRHIEGNATDEDASPRGLKKALNAEKDARQEISRACTETPLTDDNPMDESPAAAVDE